MKSKAAGCGSISTVIYSINLLYISSLIMITIVIIIIIIIINNYFKIRGRFTAFCCKNCQKSGGPLLIDDVIFTSDSLS